MTFIVTVQSQLCGVLTFSSMISLYLALHCQVKNQSFQDIRLDLLFISSVFQLSSDVNCTQPILL